MFYKFDQNNSGGTFVVNDKLCHRLLIEADSEDEAISKAEDLGCYWDGVAAGMDCPCCGDRWSNYFVESVEMDKYNTEGFVASIFDGIWENTIAEWEKKFGRFEIIKQPKFETQYGVRSYVGNIRFKNIEEYAQYLANEYGWTVPDARIYYKDGTVKEIFTETEKNK